LTAEVKEKLEDLSSKITETSVEPLKVLKAEIEFVTERVRQICSNYQQAQVAYSDALKNAHNSNETWEKALQSNKKALETIEQTNIHVTEVLDAVSQRDEGLKQIRDEISNISETISQLQELNSILTKISSK
jgi:methyl-accepting chemotaxis protein